MGYYFFSFFFVLLPSLLPSLRDRGREHVQVGGEGQREMESKNLKWAPRSVQGPVWGSIS